MVKKVNIAVLFGGRSGEHEVSLMSARSVLSVLDPEKYEICQVGITRSGQWLTGSNVLEALLAEKFDSLLPASILPEPNGGKLFAFCSGTWSVETNLDVVFPVMHGTFSEDGTLQGLLELADLAYVGAGVLASSVGMDKSLFKDVMRANDIPVVESLLFTRNQVAAETENVIAEIEKAFSYPVFVKPANLGSSVGITKCRSHSDLLEGLLDAARFDRRILVERGLNAREIEVSVLGNDDPIASIPGEVRPAEDFYTFHAKYLGNESELIIPARLDDATSQKVRELAVKTYKAIDCAGMARVDFLLDRDTAELVVSEVNTIPGFTSISMYPKLWEASGISYPALVDRLIELALQRKADRDATERVYRGQ